MTNFLIAFLAGFLTFFAGCLAPIAPVYVSHLAGIAPSKISGRYKSIFLLNSLLFTAGFLAIFIILGVTINTLARQLVWYRPFITQVSGLFLIVIGLVMGRFMRLPLLQREFSFQKYARSSSSFTLGLIFGFSWTPCIGPVLATILLWVSGESNMVRGILYLISFAVGLGTPFVLIGLSFDKLWPKFKKIHIYSHILTRLGGVVLIIFGILLLTNNYAIISSFLLTKFGNWVYTLELAN